MDVQDGATVEVESSVGGHSDVQVGLSGTLTGNGLFILGGPTQSSETTSVLGTLAPAGALTIAGNLALTSTATTMCNVTPQASDNVQVVQQYQGRTGGGFWGHATLGGRLSVIMTGTFTPATTFTLLHADAGRLGTFTSISIAYSPVPTYTPVITYDANNVYLYLRPN